MISLWKKNTSITEQQADCRPPKLSWNSVYLELWCDIISKKMHVIWWFTETSAWWLLVPLWRQGICNHQLNVVWLEQIRDALTACRVYEDRYKKDECVYMASVVALPKQFKWPRKNPGKYRYRLLSLDTEQHGVSYFARYIPKTNSSVESTLFATAQTTSDSDSWRGTGSVVADNYRQTLI